MNRPIDTPTALAGALVDLAERCATLPGEARMLLGLAARVYRETGEPDLAIQCEWTATHIKAATAQPRSRPFCPPFAPIHGVSGPERAPGLAPVSGRGRRP